MRLLKFFFALPLIMLSSCSNDENNIIKIGDFEFDFPNGYELVKEHGVDSYVGKVSDGKYDFQFDFGYYSNPLDKSLDEYLNREVWKMNTIARHNLISNRESLDEKISQLKLIEYNKIDSSVLRLKYQFFGDTLNYDLTIPQDVLITRIEIDTINNIRFKLVEKAGFIGLNVADLGSFNSSINSRKSLTIYMNCSQDSILLKSKKVLKSCRKI